LKILHVVGARPNFMKLSPVVRSLEGRSGATQIIVHTGQHYDPMMSDVFFSQLGVRQPDINLEIGSGSHAYQTGQVMIRFEPVVLQERPDVVCLYGDINSTMAGAVVCAKLGVPAAHVEAGLRSFDRTMPEEINRVITDQIADLLFTPSRDGSENLLREGVAPEKIHFVGNVMIDTLIRLLPQATATNPPQVDPGAAFVLVTLHRPSNVDDPATFEPLVSVLRKIAERIPMIFPVHPRTRLQLERIIGGIDLDPNLHLIEPLGYVDFLALLRSAKVVITDSGGIQEETTFLGVPCLTMRENTERPVTITQGTNMLIGRDTTRLMAEVERILNGARPSSRIPELWDGHAGERIADILCGTT
jgi:UDP-N-acetylglucosamine 2-epimerase (non-hydrolysing)